MDALKNNNLINYQRIEKAIEFINEHFKEQPSLNNIAQYLNLSPSHFQRLFTEWAGTSPKQFLQYISIQHAKSLLKEKQKTLFDTAFETGLSSTSRLHDLFIKIEGMSPAEYKNDGENLSINYQFSDNVFGKIIIASTTKGICYLAFYEDEADGFIALKKLFSNAVFHNKVDNLQKSVLSFFSSNKLQLSEIKLHLKGTDFQLKIWEALLTIPMGELATYGEIAQKIQKPNASRAVGTAIGNNPIAFLIPCHRVIQASGKIGGYMWGNIRKTAMIGWESAQTNKFNSHT